MPKRVTAVIANVAHDNSECEDLGLAILNMGTRSPRSPLLWYPMGRSRP